MCVCSGAFQIVWLCLQKTARRSLLLFYLRLWNEHSFSFLPSLDVQHKAIIFSLSCCWYVCSRCCCSTREYYIASYDPLWRLDNLLLSCTKSRFEDRPFTRHPPPASRIRFINSSHSFPVADRRRRQQVYIMLYLESEEEGHHHPHHHHLDFNVFFFC